MKEDEYTKETIKVVELFFEERFIDKNLAFEKKCGYFWEWCDRFDSGMPENYMDAMSRVIFEDSIKLSFEYSEFLEASKEEEKK